MSREEKVGARRKVREGRDVGNDGKGVIGREEIKVRRGGQMANTIVRGKFSMVLTSKHQLMGWC